MKRFKLGTRVLVKGSRKVWIVKFYFIFKNKWQVYLWNPVENDSWEQPEVSCYRYNWFNRFRRYVGWL